MENKERISNIQKWREVSKIDETLIKSLKRSDKHLLSSFSTNLEFGTAGILGKMGAGTSQINEFTISAAAKAYALFLLEKSKNPSIVIGHDNRTNSKLYTIITAKIMIENGVRAYIYDDNELQPTPFVSFTIRDMKLDGGVIITASHNPKEYNGFKVYDNKGAQLLTKDTQKISDNMKKIDMISVAKSNDEPLYVPKIVANNYIESVLGVQINPQVKVPIKIAFSAQNGTAAKMMPELMKQVGVGIDVVKKQNTPDPTFRHTKTPNPEDVGAYNKVANLAFWKKSDIILTTDPGADRLGVGIRNRKTTEYMNGNEIAALYLDYRLSELKKRGLLPKNGFIVTTYVSGDLPRKIAKSYGVDVIDVNVGFKNIAKVIEKEKKSIFLFGYDESYGFLIDPLISRDKDALQAAVGVVDMAKYHKSCGINSFETYNNLSKKYGTHISAQLAKNLSNDAKKKLFKRFKKMSSINEDKVKRIEDYSDNSSDFLKIIFESGSWIALRALATETKVKIYSEVISSNSPIETETAFAEKLNEKVDEVVEEINDKKINTKSIFKYIFFSSLVISLLVIVFLFIYSDSSSGKNGSISSYSIAGAIINSTSKWIWLTWWLWKVFTIFLNSWMKKRMFDIQHHNVKVRHLMIASTMGAVIAFVTPFAVGGDAIGYWYLRRKGVKRAPLIATLITDTMLGETKFALQTILLVGIGWGVYKQIFNGSPESQGALIWFFIGLSWSFFAAFMIMFITLSRKFQNASINTAVKLLKWMPYVHLSNSEKVGAKYKYELGLMRKSMKLLWSKWTFGLEMIFYTMIPLFISPTALIYVCTGWNNINIPTGGYMSQIIVGDIVGTANSMSITPGGSGTKEWLSIQASQVMQVGSRQQVLNNFTGQSIASARDMIWKILYEWPFLAVSTGSILSIIFIERKSISKDIRKKRKIIASILLGVGILTYLLIYFLVLF